MKALANPLLLLAGIVLLAADSTVAAEGDAQLEGVLLALCVLGFIVNVTLALARAVSARPAVACVLWAVAFLLFGSASWLLVSDDGPGSVTAQERISLRHHLKDWRAGGDPYALDEDGDSLLLLAAGLGRGKLITRLLEADADALRAQPAQYAAALHRAAERNRVDVLRLLVAQGVPVDARVGEATALHAAALAGTRLSAACLLELGASVNAAGEDAATPLHYAVEAEDAAMVRLLVQHGADPAQPDSEGNGAACYARTEEIDAALNGNAPAEP